MINFDTKGVLDAHIHCGPEIIPRKYDSISLSQTLHESGMSAVIKNHFTETASWACMSAKYAHDNLIGAVVLNHYVGGISEDAIRGALGFTHQGKPALRMVWMPTMHAAGHIQMRKDAGSDYDIPEEWTGGKPVAGRQLLSSIAPISFNNTPLIKWDKVLEIIAANDLVLATGHLTGADVKQLVPLAHQHGVKRILITHPLYGATDLKANELRDLVSAYNVYVEQTYALYLLDHIAIERKIEQIQAVGIDNTILSSDLGQLSSPPPADGLKDFAAKLVQAGLTLAQIDQMTKINPQKLIL